MFQKPLFFAKLLYLIMPPPFDYWWQLGAF